MTLPASGQIHMYEINTEFGRGYDLNAYRGVQWWTDAGATGNFSSSQISMDEFHGKRASSPNGVNTLDVTSDHSLLAVNGVIQLGAAAADRYIVVSARQRSPSTQNKTFSACTIGGVGLPLIQARSVSYLADISTSLFCHTGLFGGYFPNNTSGALVLTRSTDGNVASDVTVYRLTGAGLRVIYQDVSNSGNSPASKTFPAAAKSAFMTSNCSSGQGGFSWSGINQNSFITHNLANAWQSAAGSVYYGSAGSYGVTASGVAVSYIGIGP